MWPPVATDHRRKTSPYTTTVPGYNWSREMHPNDIRYANSSTYQHDSADGHDVKFLGERTSEETVVEVETSGVNKNNLHDNPDDSLYVNVVNVAPRQSNNATLREKHRRFHECSEVNMPEAMVAMQKLQRLKELQMKRDMSERYYTHEIKRLIGEYYFGSRVATPSLRPQGKLQSASFQQCTEDRSKRAPYKSLEPCGTMTTITKLDCGCIQETTRPIFTTARGRVQRKNCSQTQDEEQVLKLTSSNPPEHLLTSIEQHKAKQRMKSKKQLSSHHRTYAKILPDVDQGFETENERRIDAQEIETPDRLSRSPPPREKFSDTSATSV
ncbi:uncharacterized protein LOC128878603 [Hylaeus volcanicus]|uniref:uncharacterized protein LOC128878603 n=1 Tax=Hylaeus volcanicus TaxID=313075 RepID=UPI0023B77CD1|nr:uncharacterized protein LOC128878603 [Hylaeus volcanicus]